MPYQHTNPNSLHLLQMARGGDELTTTTDPRSALRARRLLLRLAAAEGESEQVCRRGLRDLGVAESTIARAAELWRQAARLLEQADDT